MKREPIPAEGRLQLTDGRVLAYTRYGVPGGAPLVFFHGLPGSRWQAAPVHDAAAACGLELVAFDRPGFGASDPSPARRVDDVIADVADLADHLGHRRFGVVGVSCGGPYALATARLLPQRVIGVGLLAGMGPMDRPALRRDQLPLLRAMFRLARIHRWLASPLLALDALLLRSRPERAVEALAALLGGPDRVLLQSDAALRAAFAASLAEAYRQGIGGALRELQRIAHHGSAGLDAVQVPVQVFQSGHDRHVPPAMGAHLAATLPDATLHACPHDGHLSIVVHQFAACARLVMRAA